MCQCNPESSELPDDVARLSLYIEGTKEAHTHKWILSEQAGRDLGEHAILDWTQKHWNAFLRARWIDHLFGRKYWIELEASDFGLLKRRFRDSACLPMILDELARGRENLNIIDRFHRENRPVDEMLEILEELDVNSTRLQFKLVQRLTHGESDVCPCRLAG
jgi:hypothetical protein